MSKRRNKEPYQYSKFISIVTLLITVVIYFLVGFINGYYSTYEQPALSQVIYGVLALIALGCLISELVLAVKYKTILWKTISVVSSIIALFVTIICLLGIASVNFF